ncbi:hypothetical protein BDZ88DRAFT_414550 [Geranomyces variabilis]|nr:hypothetical protein BDZ88DRAFT_414550 [Geranomyces variabilis]KAJ3141049.1 hypothetical protein HDU90_007072 [Geranomyces variabilis]
MNVPLEMIEPIVNNVDDPLRRLLLCYALRLTRLYQRFPQFIKEAGVFHASIKGRVHFLRWLLSNDQEMQCPENAIDVASMYGITDVLQVWKDSGIKMRYSRFAMHAASKAGDIKCLDWWAASGLKLKYSETKIVKYCRLNGEVCDLWRKAVPHVFGERV